MLRYQVSARPAEGLAAKPGPAAMYVRVLCPILSCFDTSFYSCVYVAFTYKEGLHAERVCLPTCLIGQTSMLVVISPNINRSNETKRRLFSCSQNSCCVGTIRGNGEMCSDTKEASCLAEGRSC